MQDFLLNTDNKEILIEILHHSIDYLIGNRRDDKHTLRLCHKFGFHSPDDFMLTTRTIARCYHNCCLENSTEAELLSEFANLSPELQRLVPAVLAARRPEIINYLIRHQNAKEHPLVESFDWDLRYILGDSSYAYNQRQIVTVTFNNRNSKGNLKPLHIQMNPKKLDEFIKTLQLSISNEATNKK
ncbi:uncharacterized protein LOC119689246 [Teleopsis dalmanni]|uniref:uncharacterized protein LOC119689246 n=1 Tax=Teleopsis dalmanni TaxID=139649 RepID=UPI0018CE8619|nr:uncharacterized protein LOC119689246 [Teleopsis dalmanni]